MGSLPICHKGGPKHNQYKIKIKFIKSPHQIFILIFSYHFPLLSSFHKLKKNFPSHLFFILFHIPQKQKNNERKIKNN